MALPFLPEHEIPPMFENLSQQVQDPALCNLVTYIKDQWIESQTFPPTNWSIYKQAIRTNNDIEGWHNALNRHVGSRANLFLYLLIEILNKETEMTAINIRLVSERKLKRIQRKKYRKLQERLFNYWELYENCQKTSDEFLRFCSHLNGPAHG
jgi:hypothetical protein